MRAHYDAIPPRSAALITLLVALLSRVATLTFSQEILKPLSLDQVGSGIYVHAGEVALMNAANEGAIANIAAQPSSSSLTCCYDCPWVLSS